jgi:2'-5' RNA ligase
MEKDLYMVALIPNHIKNQLSKYQKEISNIYGLYDEYPELHITLSKLVYNDEEQIFKLISILNHNLASQKPFPVEINGASCFNPPYKSVNIHVIKNEHLINISKIIDDSALGFNITPADTYKDREYHISIANPNFAKKDWSDKEYEEACHLIQGKDIHKEFIIDTIQMWYPIKEDYIITSFNLK